jgi:hypothetical protein
MYGPPSLRGSARITCGTCLHAGLFHEEKRHFAYAWLRAQAKKRSRREKQILRYVQFTLAAAVAALIVGVVGLLLR